MNAKQFNFWPWLPLLVIGAAAVANGAIILVAKRVSPQKVEDQPFAASVRFDADKAAAEAFIARGLRLEVSAPDPASLHLAVSGGAGGPGEIRLYRPDAPAADRIVGWAEISQPLTIPLTRAGVWRIDLRLNTGEGIPLAAKTVIDTTGGRHP